MPRLNTFFESAKISPPRLLAFNFAYFLTFLTIVMTITISISWARQVRLLSLAIEADEKQGKSSLIIDDETRLFLTTLLSTQLIQVSEQKLVQIDPQELAEQIAKSEVNLDTCAEHCPQLISQLTQADLIISGRLFRFGQEWRLLLSISTPNGLTLVTDKLKGTLKNIETAIEKQAQHWYQSLKPTLVEISKTPIQVKHIFQAKTAQKNRWHSLGITWLPIQGGQFEMGDQQGSPDERPVHMVKVSSFQLMKTEVTAEQYWACVQAKHCSPIPEKEGCVLLGANVREAVNCVTWLQAQAFANWIGARLPTEAEWELAAKGLNHRKYPWGNQPASCERLSYLNPKGQEGCGEAESQAPCQYPQGISPEGACDLAGNVWEWVEDDWHKDYHTAPIQGAWCDETKENLLQPKCLPQERGYKTYRGGSWYHPADRARSSARAGALHHTISPGVGFRCAL